MSNFNVEIQDLAIFKKIKNKEVKGGVPNSKNHPVHRLRRRVFE